ncbi:hypothetical protein Taro_034810, partial [Colocasia esculenta]|nr:hypothetical protein [Colocasia esculenta]
MEDITAGAPPLSSVGSSKHDVEEPGMPFPMPAVQFHDGEVAHVEMVDCTMGMEMAGLPGGGGQMEVRKGEMEEMGMVMMPVDEEKGGMEQLTQEPAPGMEFESSDAARQFYVAYAERLGFRVRNSKSFTSRVDDTVIMRRFVCSKQGRPTKKDPFDLTKKRRNRVSSREGCRAMFQVNRRENGRWVVSRCVLEHCHPLGVSPVQSAVIHKKMAKKPDIMSKCKEKLADVYSMHPGLKSELKKCINESETDDQFDMLWRAIIGKYGLEGNAWLHYLFSIRHRWVPLYFMNSFFAEIGTVQKLENMHKFFQRHSITTTTLRDIVTQFDKAMANQYEKEVQADSATLSSRPVLKTPSPMEKQASDIYTKTIFDVFQEELLESSGFLMDKIDEGVVSKFRVANLGFKIIVIRLCHGDVMISAEKPSDMRKRVLHLPLFTRLPRLHYKRLLARSFLQRSLFVQWGQ